MQKDKKSICEERKVEKANISEEKANNMEEREKNTCYDDGEYNTKRQFSKRIKTS